MVKKLLRFIGIKSVEDLNEEISILKEEVEDVQLTLKLAFERLRSPKNKMYNLGSCIASWRSDLIRLNEKINKLEVRRDAKIKRSQK